MADLKTIGHDGEDEIIFSQSFLIHNNELTIPDILGYSFKFIFEKSSPKENQKDIGVTWKDKQANVVLSNKFRNTLGAGVTEKLKILKDSNGKFILFSIYGHQFAGGFLNVVINFYRAK